MFTLTSALFLTLFATSWIFVLCQGTLELNVTAGDNATLPCQGQRGADIALIEWNRTDLKVDNKFVFYFRDDQKEINPLATQHDRFHHRVELRDPDRKNGDASVILKNVRINDTGTYECRIGEKTKSRRRKRDAEPQLISTIELTVTEPGGHKEGGDEKRNVGPMVGLPVFAVLLVAVAVVGTMIFKKRRGNTAHTGEQTESLNPPSSV